MLFCSPDFLYFFSIVFAIYWSLPWGEVRVYLLLVASFVFYATWNEWLACLIVVSTVMDFLIARTMDRSGKPGLRKLLLSASIAFNLGVLCYFKYANFFLRELEDVLHRIGAETSFPVLKVILPVGISFYTFEAISYTIDVYRRKLKAETNLAHFMLFILFFPHLIAGPIVRASDFLPQIRRKKRWNWLRIRWGLQLFILGMFKKLAVGDRMGMFVDPVFGDPESYKTATLWLSAFAFAIQVYCDFSGYTDMALGAARLLGYKLSPNFNLPYLSPNIAEFWRRWHISLSSWLRDYLFFPLGGSRSSRWKTYRNLLIVMALGGLWHGAAWPYLMFGIMQGIWLSAHRTFREWCDPRVRLKEFLLGPSGTVLRVASTFVLFTCTLVVFRSPTLLSGATMLKNMVVPHAGSSLPLHQSSYNFLVLVFAFGYAFAAWDGWRKWWQVMPSPARGLAYAAILTSALILAPDSGKAFIYFQF